MIIILIHILLLTIKFDEVTCNIDHCIECMSREYRELDSTNLKSINNAPPYINSEFE